MKYHKAIFFQARTQYKNTGDVLINKSLLDQLRQYAYIVVNDKGVPDWYLSEVGVTPDERASNLTVSFHLYLIKSVFGHFINRNRPEVYVISAPGHRFGNSISKSLRNIVSAIYFLVLRLFGTTVIKIGFSIGPIGKVLALSENFRAMFINYYLVRESLSLELCRKIGIKKAAFFPDLAWTYTPICEITLEEKRKSKIHISFRDGIFTGDHDQFYINNLKNFLVNLIQKMASDYIIEVVYQVAMDYDFCKQLYYELRDVGLPVSFREQQLTLKDAANCYRESEAVITNRLHVALLAARYRSLPIILTDIRKHLKIAGIFEDAGLSELLLDTSIGTEENIEAFNALLVKRGVIMKQIIKSEERYHHLSQNILDLIFKI